MRSGQCGLHHFGQGLQGLGVKRFIGRGNGGLHLLVALVGGFRRGYRVNLHRGRTKRWGCRGLAHGSRVFPSGSMFDSRGRPYHARFGFRGGKRGRCGNRRGSRRLNSAKEWRNNGDTARVEQRFPVIMGFTPRQCSLHQEDCREQRQGNKFPRYAPAADCPSDRRLRQNRGASAGRFGGTSRSEGIYSLDARCLSAQRCR